jgi:hypothetical protein
VKKRDLPPCLQFANTALKGSGTLVVLAIYCKISLYTIRRADYAKIFLQKTIISQAIKLGAVQPFQDVIPLRVIKNQAILVGSRITV